MRCQHIVGELDMKRGCEWKSKLFGSMTQSSSPTPSLMLICCVGICQWWRKFSHMLPSETMYGVDSCGASRCISNYIAERCLSSEEGCERKTARLSSSTSSSFAWNRP